MIAIQDGRQARFYALAWSMVEEAALVPTIAFVPSLILTLSHFVKLYPPAA